MDQSLATWILVVLALITASLPFVCERPFLVLPWSQKGEAVRPFWLLWLESLAFFALLAGLGWLTLYLIGGAFSTGGDLASAALFLGKVVVVAVLAVLLLGYPGWRSGSEAVKKSFFIRLLELLLFYYLVGMLGFAFETNIGNVFAQRWEFYAITFSLFLVLAYPGFVYRYLLNHRKAKGSKK